MAADPVVRDTVAIGDPNAPSHVLKPNADGSINVEADGALDAVTATTSATSATSLVWTGAAPFNGTFSVPTQGFALMNVFFTGVGTGVTAVVEGSNDNSNWVGVSYESGNSTSSLFTGGTSTPAVTSVYNIPLVAAFVRVRLNAYVSGTVTAVAVLKRTTTAPEAQKTVVGNVASGAADTGSPVKVGAVFVTAPTAVTTGQRVNVWADPFGNFGEAPYPGNAVAITAASGNVANAAAVATLAATAGKTTYISGFQCTASGATSGLAVNVTVAGVITGTMTYTFVAPAGVAVGALPLTVAFNPPIPASATNTTIVVTLPALGSGNTNAAAAAQGYQQ